VAIDHVVIDISIDFIILLLGPLVFLEVNISCCATTLLPSFGLMLNFQLQVLITISRFAPEYLAMGGGGHFALYLDEDL
jgi:hypothetical protein